LLPLSSAPPRLVAVPSAQNTVAPSVSHPPALERSSSFVTVRVPLPAPNITWKVPSSGPSGLSAVEVCPTVSRSLPRNARLIGDDAPSNVAVTLVFAVSVTVQVAGQLLPTQPVKVEPGAGTAVKVTAVPLANAAEHVVPQEIPAGLLVTVPVPVPVLLTDSVGGTAKLAVTVVAAFSVTLQVPVPEQPPPLQPEKVEPAAGAAVRVTTVPLLNAAEHVAPHVIPAGLLVTVPVPAPGLLTDSVRGTVKLAVTVVAAPSATVQVPVPEQPPPLQPVKVEPSADAAVRVTTVPLLNAAEHVAPHVIPAGLLVTVPVPAPGLLTESVKVCLKVAVTVVVAALSVTAQVPVPEQPPPLQPVKVEPAVGAAVRVMAVPLPNAAEHVAPHVIPAGLLVTVPVPSPALLTVSVEACTTKVAVTVVAALSGTLQVVPVPEQPPPLQPWKVEPLAGAAVKMTGLLGNAAEHVAPHVIPAGLLVTVPVPAPALLTVSVEAKVAVTLVFAVSVTVQVAGQLLPTQPVKVEPLRGAAVRVTAVPLANGAEHAVPHEIPAGLLVIVPGPVPALETVKVKVGARVTVKLSVAVFPAASRAVTVSTFELV
jgi:hypothetical protein